MALKVSSSELSTKAARLMAMDDDEMRREALLQKGEPGFIDPRDVEEPRLKPEFCDLVRSIAASVVSQDETKGSA